MQSGSAQNRAPLFRFLRRYTPRYFVAYSVGAIALLATNYITVLIPGFVQQTIDEINAGNDESSWNRWIVFIIGLALALIVTRTFSRVLFFNPGRTIEFRLRNTFFHHLLDMGSDFFRRFNIGEIISRGTNDMTSVRSIIGYAMLQLFNVTIALSLTLYKMISINGRLTLYCVAPFFIAIFVLRHGIRLLLIRYRLAQQQLASLSNAVMESYSGFAMIQGFNATQSFADRFDVRNDVYVENYLGMARIRSFYLPVVGVIGSACIAILLFYGGRLAIEGDLTLGAIAAYAAYIGIVVAALNSSGWVINSIQRGLVSLSRVYEVLDSPSDLKDIPEEEPGFQGRAPALKVENLTIRYPDSSPDQPPALQDLSFRVEPGHTLGLFGPTGSGKTTLLSAIARLLPPPPGSIFFDRIDLCKVPTPSLRKIVSMVPQDAYLFSRSIRENIGFKDLPEEIDDEKVAEAIDISCLESELSGFTKGVHTIVGERGITLSGGQRQRVAIARAFYRSFSMLILDDVLAAVDHQTEKKIIQNIHQHTAEHTTLISSHRISALLHADLILVLEHGRITHQGTHTELIDRPGIYADTWRYQQEEEEEEFVGDRGGGDGH